MGEACSTFEPRSQAHVERCVCSQKSATPTFRGTLRDHEPNHLMIYCPHFYFQAALRTWRDPAVFEPVEGSPEQLSTWVLDRIPGLLRKRYKWGINPSGTLPVGFVFLKRKKEFLKGRTIISYSNSCIKELLKAASQAILLMIRLVWPEAMGLATTPQL